jgi:3-phosphoshikimate 1-carboxyvinyltransferase
MQPLLESLTALGASCVSMRGDGYAPVIIQGPITSGKTRIEGQDSQPVSALLIASAFAEGPVEITVQRPGEKPWVALTLDWFDKRGIAYENHNFEYYRVLGKSRYEGFEYHVPGDFSSAAFPIAAALITQSEITLRNIDMADVQGDKELIYLFIQMGACIDIDDNTKSIRVKKSPALHGCVVDANDFVDAVTILATVACFAEGETHIHNVAVARKKECNRIECITKELKKMGADITETEDGLYIRKSSLKGAHVHSYHDHRMAMSLAVAGMGAEGETYVSSIECVAKTFPSFMQDFATLGCSIQELQNS